MFQYSIPDIYYDKTIDLTDILNTNNIKLSYLQNKIVTVKDLYKLFDVNTINEEYIDIFNITNESSLEQISYNIYNDYYLWWVILLLNKDIINNPYIFNLNNDQISTVANYLNNLSNNKFKLQLLLDLLNEYNNKNKKIRYIKQSFLNEFFRINLGVV